MKKYYAICKRCGDEVVSFHSGLSPCNHIWCGGLVFCYPKKRRRTPHALDGRDSAPSQAVSSPEVLSDLQAVSSPALPQVM